jgi:hypothetical protein
LMITYMIMERTLISHDSSRGEIEIYIYPVKNDNAKKQG